MTIAETPVGDVTILRLTGRLELEEGDLVFRDYINRLVDEGRVKIVLDLKDVTHIDSAGLGMLVSKYVSTRNRGGTIKLLQPDAPQRSPDGHHAAGDSVRDLRRGSRCVAELRSSHVGHVGALRAPFKPLLSSIAG